MGNVSFFSQHIPVMLPYSQNFLRVFCLSVELPSSASQRCSPVSIRGLRLSLGHNSSGSDGSPSWMHLLRAGTLLTRHGAKTAIWSCPPAPGPLCQIRYFGGVTPTCQTDFWDVDTAVGANICCCCSAVSSFRRSRSKDENMFRCLPPACSTWETLGVSSERLNSCGQTTPYPLPALEHRFNSQLLPRWILTASGIPLGTELSLRPFSHPRI